MMTKRPRPKVDYSIRFRWYVKPTPGDCARPYPQGTQGGKWRLYRREKRQQPICYRKYYEEKDIELIPNSIPGMRLFVATRKIGDKAKKPKSEADKLFDKYLPDSIAGKPDPNLSSKFKKFYEEWHSAFEEEGLFDNDRRFRIRSLVHPAYIINKKTGQRRPRPINFPEFFTYSDPITWRPLEQIKTYDRRVNRFKALYCYINRFRFANRALGLRHVSTCTMDRKIVLWEDKSTLGIWPGPIEKYPNPLYSIAGIYERGKERQSRPAGLQVFDADYETVKDEYGEYEIEGLGKLGEKEDDLSWGPASRDKERGPGDYDVANDDLEREYEGDTRGVSYRKDESYVNELPHRRKTNKKHASQAARTARDGFGSSYPILGTCLECGGDLAKGLPVWNSHATKYIMQDFVDIHIDDIVCLQCGLIHKLPADGPKITPAMDGCLLDGTLQNDMSIYVPFDLEIYEKSKTDRVRLLKEYYASNPGAEKPPKDRDLALPIQECYKKHDRLTLKDPEKGLHPEKIKRRQIVRTIMAMWSREELPDDPIMAVMNSTIKQRSFTEKFNELYDEKLSTRDVVRRMEMAQHELHEIKMAEIKKTWARMRKHHRQEGANLNLGNFIKP